MTNDAQVLVVVLVVLVLPADSQQACTGGTGLNAYPGVSTTSGDDAV